MTHRNLKLLLINLLFLPVILLANDIPSGNAALELWDSQGAANSPQWVQIWLYIMLGSFAAGLLFVWKHSLARWVVGGFLGSMIAKNVITSTFDVLPLSGFVALLHLIFWSPALYCLLKTKPFMGEKTAFAIWSGIMTAVIIFSFIFDIRDAVIYIHYLITR